MAAALLDLLFNMPKFLKVPLPRAPQLAGFFEAAFKVSISSGSCNLSCPLQSRDRHVKSMLYSVLGYVAESWRDIVEPICVAHVEDVIEDLYCSEEPTPVSAAF